MLLAHPGGPPRHARTPMPALVPDAGPDAPTSPESAAPPGTVIFVPPPADLAPFVEYLWQLVLPRGDEPDVAWRVVVDGYVDLAMTLVVTPEVLRAAAAARASGAARGVLAEALAASRRVVCGATHAARLLPLTERLLLTGVRFRMGAATGVLRHAPGELVDGSRPLSDVLDRRVVDDTTEAVGDARAACPHAQAAAALAADAAPNDDAADGRAADGAEHTLQAFARTAVAQMARRLVARAAARPGGARPADPRVRGALHLLDRLHHPAGQPALGQATIGQSSAPRLYTAPPSAMHEGQRVAAVARALAVSPRTLERLFAEHVGFAPRTYQRLRRVGAVAEALEHPEGRALGRPGRAAPAGTLSELAHTLGYADHAHMTREFTRVMGVAPSRYRREALATPMARRVGPVAFERSTPLGTVRRAAAAAGAGDAPTIGRDASAADGTGPAGADDATLAA